MIEILHFIFEDVFHFWGAVILIIAIGASGGIVAEAIFNRG